MKLRALSALLALGMLLSLWGCGTPPALDAATTAADDPTTAAPTTAAATQALPPAAAFPVTVTDAAGRQVTLQQAPQALVSGYYITTSMLIALGLQGRLVGIEAKADTRPIYSLAAPALLDLPSVGTAKEFDLEGCAALSPDLVILPLALRDSIPALEALGLTVIMVRPESLAQLRETITLLGAATGAVDQAEALLAYSLETEGFLAEALADAHRPAVYLAGNSSYLSTAGAEMYQNTLIEMGGGQNVAAELEDTYWAEISYEQLLAWDPEIIIIAPSAKYTRDDILADPQLAALGAVQSGRVHTMPAGLEAWDSPVPSAAVGSRWMASTLHPDRYPTDSFAADADAFYQTFYGMGVDAALLTP